MIFSGAVSFDSSGHLTDARQRRLGLPEHWESFPVPHLLVGEALLEALREVHLTGRGGAHFPVSRKLASVVDSGAQTVVVNGAETEVLSSKDAALLQLHPHLVLDGAQALARLVRADEVVVWLQEGSAASFSSVQVAVYERERDARHRGEVPVRILFGPERYLTGEATAAIAGVRGLPVLPRFVEHPAAPWVEGAPVLVHNVETHARIGLLARLGSANYPATSLVTLVLPRHRLVIEAPQGTTFEGLLAREHVSPPEHVLLGGYSGTWEAWERLAPLAVDPVSLRRQGVALGTGIIAVPPHGAEPLEWTAEILHWMSDQRAGQCGPCIFGLPELAAQFADFVRAGKRSSRQRKRLDDLMQLIDGRGACRHPDGVVRLARSAIATFAPAVVA